MLVNFLLIVVAWLNMCLRFKSVKFEYTVKDRIPKGKLSHVGRCSERFGVKIEIVNFTRLEGLGDMASTNRLHPPKISLPEFIGSQNLMTNVDLSKFPKVRVTEIMSLGGQGQK